MSHDQYRWFDDFCEQHGGFRGGLLAAMKMSEKIADLQNDLATANRDRYEALAEAAACIDFIQTEIKWADFRAEMLGDTASERNFASLTEFVRKTGRGLTYTTSIRQKVLADIERRAYELADDGSPDYFSAIEEMKAEALAECLTTA